MANREPLIVLLDTNVLVSAFVFGGKPRELLRLVIEKRIQGITSPFILMELFGVLLEKFHFQATRASFIEKKIRKYFQIIYPTKIVNVLGDNPDNKILEAALAGNCVYIITGDKELLSLGRFKRILIITPARFFEILRA